MLSRAERRDGRREGGEKRSLREVRGTLLYYSRKELVASETRFTGRE